MTTSVEELNARVEALYPQVVAWRRHVHAHPDISFEEEPTANYVEKELKRIDTQSKLRIHRPVPQSVVADLVGEGGEGPCIAIRADMDALPVHEEVNVPFRSTVDGKMHACGHDSHTAMLMGAVKLALEDVGKLKGTVRFIFQHAEELAPGGARDLVKAGVMDGVRYVFALHVVPPSYLPTGTVLIKNGPLYTGSLPVEVVVKGKGGHASSPELAIDPVPIAAHIISNVQSVVTRRFEAVDAPVVTVTNVSTSTDSFNIIADSVNLKFSIRYRNSAIGEPIKAHLTKVFEHLCAANDATCEIHWKDGYAVTENVEEAFRISEKVALRVVGEENVVYYPKTLGPSEDFSAYLTCCPGNYYCIGSYNEAEECIYNNHHPKFKLDESAMKVGLKMHYGHLQELLM